MAPSNQSSLQYHIFLFSMWKEAGESFAGQANWRFSLLNPHTAQRIGFASLEALTRYLQTQIENAPRDGSDETR